MHLLTLGADVVLVQEHKLSMDQLPSLSTACRAQGWHGVWAPAASSSGHHLARSGGVTILVPSHILITQGVDVPSHRHLHAYIQWTRTRLLRLLNVYAFDVSLSLIHI